MQCHHVLAGAPTWICPGMFHQAKLNGGVARFRPSADTAGPGSFIQNAAVERVVVTGGETVNLLHPPLLLSRRSNKDGEGVSAERQSRRRLGGGRGRDATALPEAAQSGGRCDSRLQVAANDACGAAAFLLSCCFYWTMRSKPVLLLPLLPPPPLPLLLLDHATASPLCLQYRSRPQASTWITASSTKPTG